MSKHDFAQTCGCSNCSSKRAFAGMSEAEIYTRFKAMEAAAGAGIVVADAKAPPVAKVPPVANAKGIDYAAMGMGADLDVIFGAKAKGEATLHTLPQSKVGRFAAAVRNKVKALAS